MKAKYWVALVLLLVAAALIIVYYNLPPQVPSYQSIGVAGSRN